MQTLTVNSVADILKSDSPSLVLLKLADPILPIEIITNLINDMLDFFNVSNTMTGQQVGITAKMIMDDPYYAALKPDDYVYFFNLVKKGNFGTTYNRMDGPVILEMLGWWIDERNDEIERIRKNEAIRLSKQVAEGAGAPMPEFIKELAKKKAPCIVKEARVLKQTDRQKEINLWMHEFDSLYSDQENLRHPDERGRRLVEIDLKLTDVQRLSALKAIENDYLLDVDVRPEIADRIKNQKISRIQKKSMDISEYLLYRNDLKNETNPPRADLQQRL